MPKSLIIINNKDANEDIIVVRIDGNIYVSYTSGVKLLNELSHEYTYIEQIKLAASQLDTDHIDLLGLVESDYRFIEYIENQTEEICLAAIKQNACALYYIKNQTPEMCLAAVKDKGYALKFVNNQTEVICLVAVNQNGHALQFVKNQTDAICLAAVKNKGYALDYVIDQTPEICLSAARQNGWALRFVKNQTEEMCLAAIKENGDALWYIKEKTLQLCLISVDYTSYRFTEFNSNYIELYIKRYLKSTEKISIKSNKIAKKFAIITGLA